MILTAFIHCSPDGKEVFTFEQIKQRPGFYKRVANKVWMGDFPLVYVNENKEILLGSNDGTCYLTPLNVEFFTEWKSYEYIETFGTLVVYPPVAKKAVLKAVETAKTLIQKIERLEELRNEYERLLTT